MEKTIIFLGAGASKAEGAPLQNEIFKEYVNTMRGDSNNEIERKIKQNIGAFFKKYFGLELIKIKKEMMSIDFPTFEEALGILDLAILKNEGYKNEKNNLQDIRNSLIYSMAAAIHEKLDDSQSKRNKYHDQLVSKLQNELLRKEIVLISTNYDLLADNAILHSGYKCDYGFEYEEDNMEKTIRLLKIHGSLNWLYCPVCKNIHISDGRKRMIDAVLNPHNSKCIACDTLLQSVIVPPTFYKDMSNPYLQKVYEATEKELLMAKRIIFCGYSFPDADMHIKYLLKRAEQNREAFDTLEIIIINKNNSEVEEKRYRRFFKNKNEIKYISDISFEDFVNDPYKYLRDIN